MQLATPFLIVSSDLPSGKTAKSRSKSSTATTPTAAQTADAKATMAETNAEAKPANLGSLLASCCDCV